MLRQMKESDIDSIVNLENNTLGETLGHDMLHDILNNPIMKAYCYEDNNVLGYISVSFDGNILEILNFCVDINYQNKKIGKKLLNYAIINNYKLGCKSVILEVRKDNLRAIHLYESFGFKNIYVRKNYYKDLVDALVYELKLNDYNLAIDKEINIHCRIEKNNDFIKYNDDIQFDKYYHNFYKINNLDCIDKIIEDNKNNKFLCIEYDKPIDKKGFDEIDDNIDMAAMISAIDINDNKKGKLDIVTEENIELAYSLIYNDSLEFGADYSKKDSERIINDIKNSNSKAFVISVNNELIGFINTYVSNDICYLDHFFILEKYQKMGYGKSLFNYVINYYKNNNVNMAVLTADNEDTPKEMYSKWGFIEINRSFFSRRGN